MILSDQDIAAAVKTGEIGIDPFDADLIQPSSLDLRLGKGLRVTRPGHTVDPANLVDYTVPITFDDQPFTLHPGDFILGHTLERVTLPAHLAAKLEGKSSLGRLGLILHATAGFIDPGFDGTITLEITLVSPNKLILYPGMKIGQLCFFRMASPAVAPYNQRGNYLGQDGPTPSRYRM